MDTEHSSPHQGPPHHKDNFCLTNLWVVITQIIRMYHCPVEKCTRLNYQIDIQQFFMFLNIGMVVTVWQQTCFRAFSSRAWLFICWISIESGFLRRMNSSWLPTQSSSTCTQLFHMNQTRRENCWLGVHHEYFTAAIYLYPSLYKTMYAYSICMHPYHICVVLPVDWVFNSKTNFINFFCIIHHLLLSRISSSTVLILSPK